MTYFDEKYTRIYGNDTQVRQIDFAFGWLTFLLVIASIFVMVFVGIWSKDFPALWDSILTIFLIIFLPAVVLLTFIRLFPAANARLVYRPAEGHFSDILLQTGVCVLAGIINFTVLHYAFGQSLFAGGLEQKLFAVCNSTWEELLFCGGQIAFMRFNTGASSYLLGIGVRMLLFAVFHIVTYGNVPQAMLSMLIMGLIYGVALVVWKRVDISVATHLLLNLLAS